MRLQRPRRAALAGALAAALLAATAAAPAAASAVTPKPAPKPAPKHKESVEHALIHWINVKRAAAGVAPVGKSADLTTIAHRHAAAMARAGKVFHDPRLSIEVHGWLRLGEDVGSAARLVDLEKAFLKHSPSDVDLLSPRFRQIGVGATAHKGLLYASLILRQPSKH